MTCLHVTTLTEDLRKDTQTEKLDVATYNVLTDLRPHVDLETNTVQFCSLSRHVSLALWSNCSKNLKNKGFFFKVRGVLISVFLASVS